AIQSIAKHLGVDEKLVIDLATGELTELDAYREHRGYEGTSIDAKVFDQARKEFYKKNVQPLSKEEEKSFFKMHFLVDEDEIELVVQQIHKKINLKEAPLYLREIISAYPGMSLKSDDKMGVDPLNPVNVYRDGETLEIVYEAGKETSGFVRYQIAKVLADYFMPPSDDFEELSHYKGQLRGLEEARKHAQNIRKNIFASRLLAPTFLMEAEMRQLNPDQDMITQLADAFWMSKNFMNRRLQDLLASQFLKISHKVEGKF
ncbi:MAG: hypothetical protein KA436_11265, partial [Oligoflexales bacterium]|nr:hypothetical protein [Oligoflexales bacterium]